MIRSLILIHCSIPTTELGQHISTALLDQRLVACAHLSAPGRSFYRWEGAIQDEPEQVLTLKTAAFHFKAVTALIKEIHTYEVPEIIATPISDADPDYHQWVLDSVQL